LALKEVRQHWNRPSRSVALVRTGLQSRVAALSRRRPAPLRAGFITLAISLSVASACSTDSGGKGDFDKALQDYEAAATPEAQAYAEMAATEHLAALSQVGETAVHKNPTQAALAAMKALESRVPSSAEAICEQVRPLKEKAGDDAERLANLKRVSDSVIIDSMASALLGKVLAGPAERREAFLDLLGVQATDPNKEPLRGVAALQAVNLVNDSGEVVIPGDGSEAHSDYLSWLRHQATGLQSTIDGLTANLRERVDTCPS
jgi:hypothetical protein